MATNYPYPIGPQQNGQPMGTMSQEQSSGPNSFVPGGFTGAGMAIGGPVGAGIGAALDIGTSLFGGDDHKDVSTVSHNVNQNQTNSNVNQSSQGGQAGYNNQQGNQWGSQQGNQWGSQQGSQWGNQSGTGSQSSQGGASQGYTGTGYANTVGLTGTTGATSGQVMTAGQNAQQNQLRGFDANEQGVYNAIGSQLPGMYAQMSPEAQAQYGQQMTEAVRQQGLQQVEQQFNDARARQQTQMARTGTGPGSIANAQAAQLAGQEGLAKANVESGAVMAGQNAMNQRAAVNQGAAGIMGGQMIGMQGARQVLGTTNTFNTGQASSGSTMQNTTTNQQQNTGQSGSSTSQNYNNMSNSFNNQSQGGSMNQSQGGSMNQSQGGFSNQGISGSNNWSNMNQNANTNSLSDQMGYQGQQYGGENTDVTNMINQGNMVQADPNGGYYNPHYGNGGSVLNYDPNATHDPNASVYNGGQQQGSTAPQGNTWQPPQGFPQWNQGYGGGAPQPGGPQQVMPYPTPVPPNQQPNQQPNQPQSPGVNWGAPNMQQAGFGGAMAQPGSFGGAPMGQQMMQPQGAQQASYGGTMGFQQPAQSGGNQASQTPPPAQGTNKRPPSYGGNILY